MRNQVAVYTGSFDPFHLGHENIVRRAAPLFDRIVVGVGVNPDKQALFEPRERVELIQTVLADLPNVSVEPFSGLAVSFVRKVGARVMLRGLRALADLEYEFTMSLTNASLDDQIETFFLMAGKDHTHLSSTLIRQIAIYGGELRGFLPEPIIERVRQRCRERA